MDVLFRICQNSDQVCVSCFIPIKYGVFHFATAQPFLLAFCFLLKTSQTVYFPFRHFGNSYCLDCCSILG